MLFESQKWILFIILVASLTILVGLLNRYYERHRYLNFDSQTQLTTNPYRYYLYFLIVAVFAPIGEFLIEAYNLRSQTEIGKTFAVSIGSFFILIVSFFNDWFRKYLYMLFAVVYILLTGLVLLEVIYRYSDEITLIDFTVVIFFSFHALYSRKLYYAYSIGLALYFFVVFKLGLLPLHYNIFYVDILVLGFVLNYAIYRINRNIQDNLLLTNEILNNSNTVVIGLNKEDKIIFVSHNIDTILEISAKSIHKKQWQEVATDILQSSPNESGRSIQKIFTETQQIRIIEWVDESLNDEIRLKVGRDITERYNAEVELKINEEKFRFISENVSDIIIVTKGTDILYLSPSFEKTTGYTIAEAMPLLKKEFYFFVAPEFKKQVSQNVANAIRKKVPSFAHDYQFIDRNGNLFWREDTIDLIYDELGKQTHAIILSRDISDRKSTELIGLERQKKLLQQNNILFQLSKIPLEKKYTFEQIAQKITKSATEGLNVERVSYWDFLPDSIQCVNLYIKTQNIHDSGKKCKKVDFPAYFKAIESGLAVVATEARIHPSTKEFTERYLVPLNIFSMLDVPVRVGDILAGIVCIEHTGSVREWSQDDVSFAIKIADIISIRIEAEKRRIAETKLIENQKELLYKSEVLAAITQISQQLINTNDVKQTLENIFEIIGRAAKADRVVFWELEPSTNQLSVTASWASRESLLDTENPILQNQSYDNLRFYIEPMLQNKIYQGVISALENPVIIKRWQSRSIKSVLSLPIFVQGNFYGFINFDDCTKEQIWTTDQINILQSFVNNLSNAFERIENHRIIAENERNFRQIGETIKDVFWLFDFNTKTHIYVSPSSKKVLGVEPSYFYKEQDYIREFALPEFKHLDSVIDAQVLKNNFAEVEYQISTEDGGTRWISEKAFGIRDKNNELVRMSGICVDITEKKLYQNQIKQLSLVAEKITNGVLISDINGRVIWANQSFLEMMEIDFADLYMKDPRDLFCIQRRDIDINTVEAGFTIECEVFTFKKNKKWIEINNTSIRDDNGRVYQQIEVVIDVTQRKLAEIEIQKAQEEANIANKQKSELELRALQMQMNPHFVFNALNSIQSYILSKDTLIANNYLTKFAHLMRMFLDSSRSKFISVENEIKLLKLYIELEKLRFDDKFDFEIEVTNATVLPLEIPTMTLQPFIENAINHGLRYKTEKGFLKVVFLQDREFIHCQIIDDGVGFRRSKDIQKSTRKGYESQGLKITTDRIRIYNKINEVSIDFTISDNFKDVEDVGTKVEIKFPKV